MSIPIISTRPLLASLAAGAAIAASLIAGGGQAQADPIVACKTDGWGFLFSQRRELCDGPLRPDGSWLRRRIIYVPAHQVSTTCNTYGTRWSSSTTCSGGGWQPYREISNETYPVTPETVLADEPGNLA